MNPETPTPSNDQIENKNSWVKPLEILHIPREQWVAVIRALEETGIQPEILVERASEWSSQVETGKPFPGFPKGKERDIAWLLEGIRKLDDL